MQNEKIDVQLSMAMQLSEEELDKSEELSAGFNPLDRTWELIVSYNGDAYTAFADIAESITVLYNQFAVLVVREDRIGELSSLPAVNYIDKPKNLEFERMEGILSSCLLEVYEQPYQLTGKGCLIAVIDSGIDYWHPDFQNADGTTRIVALWDQTVNKMNDRGNALGNAPEGYPIGVLYSEEEINKALKAKDRFEGQKIVPETDTSGHGTHVAGIAGGNGRASEGKIKGVAPDCSFIIVKLGKITPKGFPRTTELMMAADFCMREAVARQMPIVINLSFGNNYGSHDGNSILEQYLNSLSFVYKSNIVVGCGNDGSAGRHAEGKMKTRNMEEIEFFVGEGEKNLNVQLWSAFADDYTFIVEAPDGEQSRVFFPGLGIQEHIFSKNGTKLLINASLPTPFNTAREVYMEFLREQNIVTSGIWKIMIFPQNIVSGRYDLWLPVTGTTSANTFFLIPNAETTITIPSCATKVIAVGAYNSLDDSYTAFSSRGFTRTNGVKPDLVAPGVNINAAAPGGGYALRTGTSMAAPFVAGSAALLMEWGIINGNDPFLYGEKVKAYLQKGARKMAGEVKWPNPRVGWGALCVKNSLPVFEL